MSFWQRLIWGAFVAGVLVALLVSRAYAVEEVPCDGFDNDSSGGDASCLTNDLDGDGYSTSATSKGPAYHWGYSSQTYGEGIDYDDTPCLISSGRECGRMSFPGVKIKGGCSGSDYKIVQENGTLSACQTGPLCEATGSGVCRYVDPTSGNNANAGTYAAPWADFKCFGSHTIGTGGDAAPGCNSGSLASGSVVYLIGSGTFSATYNSGSTFGTHVAVINYPGLTIKQYPGATAKIQTGTDSGIVFAGLGDGGKVEGLEITDSGTHPLRAHTGADDVIFVRNWIHDNDRGNNNNNSSGIWTDGARTIIRHNIIGNQNAATGSTGGNQDNMAVALFSSAYDSKVDLNVFYSDTTVGSLGSCGAPPGCTNNGGMQFKHGFTHDGTKRFYFRGNRGFNLGTPGKGPINIAAPSARVFNNYFVDSKHFVSFGDMGGADDQRDQKVQNNTCKQCNQYDTVGTVIFTHTGENPAGTDGHDYDHNILTVNKSYGTDEGIYNWCRNCTDTQYGTWVTGGLLRSSNNCFDNTNAVGDANIKWLLFNAGEPLGAQYTGLTAWQAGPIGESGSYATNLTFGTDGVVTTANCTDKGWQVGWFETVSNSAPESTGTTSSGGGAIINLLLGDET